MQGYTWSSNQRPPPQSHERPPPKYQERPPPQYQERPPPQYQEQPPPQSHERPTPQHQDRTQLHYQERPPHHYQEQFPPKYQDVRNEQPNMCQAQFNTQHYTTSQTRYSNGQQEASNHCQSFQSNLHGYNTQTNQAHPQYMRVASNTQQQYPSENPNTNGYHAQFDTQSNVSSPQNYGNTGRNQAHMYQSQQSDHGSSVENNKSWRFHMYNNGSSCSINNQQQLQPPITAPHHHHHHHQHQQQQFSRHHSGKKHKMHHQTQEHHPQSSSWAHNNGVSQIISNNRAQSQQVASYISCNSTTPPSGAQSKISLPSNNLNQSPVTYNQPELRSNAGPDVPATHFKNNQSTEQQSQGPNRGTYNVNETSQMTSTNKVQPQNQSRFGNSLIYNLLISNDNKQAGKQQSDERNAHHNTYSEQSEVCATKEADRHSHFSEPSVQCTVEPPSKRMNYGLVQRDYWNKETSVSKDRSDFGVQSVRPGIHQTGSNKDIPKGMSQHNIQYSTDPADCLEAVFALKKVSQQVHKAIAIVPPISQQTSNTAQMPDTSPEKADSPPLKIDSVYSVSGESDAQKTADDKLSESPSPTAQQEDKSLEIETTSNIADSDICSTSPVECQNNVQQGDCDSSDTSLDLSSVPVVKYTLKKLMDLVKSLEMTELSTEHPEKSECLISTIFNLYWNGNIACLVETLKSFKKQVEQHSPVDVVRDYESVVFESIETENLKKLAHCDVLNDEMYSLSEEYRSSWLNVDGQPADIEKVLSDPLLDDITVIKTTSQLFSDTTVVTVANLGVNSLKDVPKVSSDEKSVQPDTCSPTALFTPQSGNDREEIATENNDHSYAGLSRITFLSSVSNEKETFVSSVSNEKETFKKQEDNNFNTKPSDNFPLAERSPEKRKACSDEIEVFRRDHYEQTRHNVSVANSLPLSPEDNVADGVKNPEESFSTETLCNSKDTWLIEDISDDENPGNKKALNNSSDIWVVEDISDDENTGNMEVLPISSDIWNLEDISDVEHPGNKDTRSNSPDTCVVEDVSDDENSREDSLLMEITVLSSEDAKTFFHQLEDEPVCGIKTTTSKFDCPDLVACFDAPSQPIHEYNEADICSLCGTKMAISNSTNVLNSDGDLFCLRCWEQAPLLELEDQPCSPLTNEADVLSFVDERLTGQRSDHMIKSEQGQNSPTVEQKDKELKIALPETYVVNEGLTGQKRDTMVNSELGLTRSPPFLDLKVKELTVTSTQKCIVDEGLTGQKSDSMVNSELGENCFSPSLDLKVKEQTVATLKESIGNERPTGHKCDGVVKSVPGQTHSPPFLDLKVMELTVTSTKKCIVDEGLSGQNSDSMVNSELGQYRNSPSLALQVNESTDDRIDDERLTGRKRKSMVKSKLRQNCSSSLETQMQNVASPEDCVADEGLKSDSMVKSAPQKVPEIQRPAKQEKNDKAEKNRLAKHRCKRPPSKKSGSAKTDSDIPVLFAPDIVIKKNVPQKKSTICLIFTKKRPSGGSQDCSKVKKLKQHRQERQDCPDRTSPHHRENLQKVIEKAPGHSKDTPHQKSKCILAVNTTKKVRFDLYGSNREKQLKIPGRRFSAPATLTVSDKCEEYTDVLSAKQKVHNQWSSTFVHKTKTFSPRSPQKKKTQKTQDCINMTALKSHLTHRASLLSSSQSQSHKSL
ncbi:hypothetical protein R3I94_009332 [Phoxinus phoxinus]